MSMKTPTFDAWEDAKKLFYEDDEGDKHMMRLLTATVVVTTAYGERVAFGKCNRGKQFRDSRGKKVTARDAWGNTTTKLRPLYITEDECKAELRRLLDDDHLAAEAFRAINV